MQSEKPIESPYRILAMAFLDDCLFDVCSRYDTIPLRAFEKSIMDLSYGPLPCPNTLYMGAKQMSDNAQKIIDLDRKRMDAMCKKDIVTLQALLADDLVYTHSSARLDTKQSLIGGMESGTTVYMAIETSDVKAQDCGEAVVLTGVARIRVQSKGNPIQFGVRFTDIYANKGGQWQMVAWQSTRLPD